MFAKLKTIYKYRFAENEENVNETAAVPPVSEKSARGRRKNIRQQKTSTPSRRGRRSFNQSNTSEIAPTDPPASPEPVEKPDANMCLKVFNSFISL